ncbi:MAG: DUF420 domain-containing protein [Planctomycetota bacterium]
MSGFLGSRGSFMLDLVFVAMLAVVPALIFSGFLVRKKRAYGAHKRIQLGLALVLLLAVIAFEVEMRIHGWRHLAAQSKYWVDGAWNDWVDYSLVIHLCFAIPTPLLWGWLIYRAWRGFPTPAAPSDHSRFHRTWGRIAMAGMVMTAVTGWCFYWLAFVA